MNSYRRREYRVLVADPPWPSPAPRFGRKRDAAATVGPEPPPYELLSMEAIKAYPLPKLRESAVLFLWRLSSMQQEALAVCTAWGFRPLTELVWRKQTSKGNPWFGLGSVVRGSHETCLIGYRGSFRDIKPDALNVRSVIEAPVLAHSRKPDLFYETVDLLYPKGPTAELFARRQWPGWDCYGKELGG